MTHGFIYGRPVRPDEFLDRKYELLTLFNRLRNCESSAIVGEPHIGKTSLLLKLSDPVTQREYMGGEAENYIFNFIDLHPISESYSVEKFWEEALGPISLHPGHASIANQLNQCAKFSYDRAHLKGLFRRLDNRKCRLVLLLDEFERLLTHHHFQNPSFFTLLRSLASLSGGLVLITSSRLSVAEMNSKGRGLLDEGSEFFNHLTEVRLSTFDDATIEILFQPILRSLSPVQIEFVRSLAGSHPFLLQAAAATWFDVEKTTPPGVVARRFYERVSSHFDALWHHLDDRARTTAVILCLVEMGGRALGKDFAVGEMGKVESFEPQLEKLADRGLAEKANTGCPLDFRSGLLWQGKRWRISTQAFVWWVRDVVIDGTRSIAAYDDWLERKRYRFLLTQETWIKLRDTAQKAPEWAGHAINELAQAFFETLARKAGA